VARGLGFQAMLPIRGAKILETRAEGSVEHMLKKGTPSADRIIQVVGAGDRVEQLRHHD